MKKKTAKNKSEGEKIKLPKAKTIVTVALVCVGAYFAWRLWKQWRPGGSMLLHGTEKNKQDSGSGGIWCETCKSYFPEIHVHADRKPEGVVQVETY